MSTDYCEAVYVTSTFTPPSTMYCYSSRLWVLQRTASTNKDCPCGAPTLADAALICNSRRVSLLEVVHRTCTANSLGNFGMLYHIMHINSTHPQSCSSVFAYKHATSLLRLGREDVKPTHSHIICLNNKDVSTTLDVMNLVITPLGTHVGLMGQAKQRKLLLLSLSDAFSEGHYVSHNIFP